MDEEGVSPVIGTILVLGILTVVTSTLLTVVWPQIQDTRDRGDFEIVTGQLSRVGSDMSQMAIAGNVGEIRQRSVATSDGRIAVETGHLWAVSVGLFGESYASVAGQSADVGRHPSFNVSAPSGPGGDRIEVTYHDWDHNATANNLYWTVFRFTGSDLEECTVCKNSGAVQGGAFFEVQVDGALRDGPWFVKVRESSHSGPVIGHVYVYELNRVSYQFQGSLKERGLLVENGAVFVQEGSASFAVGNGLYRTAGGGGGTNGVNLRMAQLASPEMPETNGRARTTFQLTLTSQEHLGHDLGAAHARLEPLAGPMSAEWSKHLAGDTYDPDTGATGIAFKWDGPDDTVVAFPVSVIYSDIRLRMVSN